MGQSDLRGPRNSFVSSIGDTRHSRIGTTALRSFRCGCNGNLFFGNRRTPWKAFEFRRKIGRCVRIVFLNGLPRKRIEFLLDGNILVQQFLDLHKEGRLLRCILFLLDRCILCGHENVPVESPLPFLTLLIGSTSRLLRDGIKEKFEFFERGFLRGGQVIRGCAKQVKRFIGNSLQTRSFLEKGIHGINVSVQQDQCAFELLKLDLRC